MRLRFYVGPEHHWTHLRFAHSALGGDRILRGAWQDDFNTYEAISDIDDVDTVWIFADLYTQILPKLRGRAVFLPHGLGFKPYLNSRRHSLINEFVTQVWSTGALEEEKYRRGGVDMRKVRRIGYGVPFILDPVPEQSRSVFVSIGWFTETAHWQDMVQLLATAPTEVTVYFSVHPSMPENLQHEFRSLESPTKRFVSTEAEMLKMYHHCERAVGGYSSVLTPFFHLGKPVAMVKTRNRFPWFQWTRLYLQTRSPTWFRVMRTSTRVALPGTGSWDAILAARPSPAARDIFYPTNWSRDVTVDLMKQALSELAERRHEGAG